jgi:hypothetical protein
MREKEILLHMRQIEKVRGQLNAPNTPINDIKKPYMMRTVVFNRRIKRLKRHEDAYIDIFEAGLVRWFNKTY